MDTTSFDSAMSAAGTHLAANSFTEFLDDLHPESCGKGGCSNQKAIYVWENCLIDVGEATVAIVSQGGEQTVTAGADVLVQWVGAPEIDEPGGQNEVKNSIVIEAVRTSGTAGTTPMTLATFTSADDEYTEYVGEATFDTTNLGNTEWVVRVKSGNFTSADSAGTIIIDP